MKTELIARFTPIISGFASAEFFETAKSKQELLLHSGKDISIYYAPFDYINASAKLMLVGITPGRTQMNNALRKAAELLKNGTPIQQAMPIIKRAASFSGDMRGPLISMLDNLGFNRRLGIPSCKSIFDEGIGLAHFTSALRYPVFLADEKNYNGTPDMTRHPVLREHLHRLAEDIVAAPNALVLPLGTKVTAALQYLVDRGSININRVLHLGREVVEFPHPSGQNGESINLALMKELPSISVYQDMMLERYRQKKETKGEHLTNTDIAAYRKKRETYWLRASLLRKVVASL